MATSNNGRTESVSNKRTYDNSNTPQQENFIRSIKKFVLTKETNIGYEAQVIHINNKVYLGLTKMWFDKCSQTWKPSRKSVFLPKAAFESLKNFLNEISNLMSFPPNSYIPLGPTYTPSLGPIEETKEDTF